MSTFDSIHNYYERLVIEEIEDNYIDKGLPEDQIADLACIALNHLPPRYIRHDIDMSFYLSPSEWQEVQQRVKTAVINGYRTLLEKGSQQN